MGETVHNDACPTCKGAALKSGPWLSGQIAYTGSAPLTSERECAKRHRWIAVKTMKSDDQRKGLDHG